MVKTWRTKPTKNSRWYVAVLERDVVEVGRLGEDEALSAGHTSPARCAIFFLAAVSLIIGIAPGGSADVPITRSVTAR
jgi:hypothetical protein